MKRGIRTVTALSLLLLGCVQTHGPSTAPNVRPLVPTQGYPTKPVRIIEPFGVGGGPDLLARALAPRLAELWGQPVTVENLTGAGATAGPALVAQSPADGYTLLLSTSAQAYSAVFAKNLPYDPSHDFVPVAALTSQPYVLVASTAAGFKTVSELIAAARARPGELTFGSAGTGTGTHLAVEKLNLEAGIAAVHVPASGVNATADVIANTVAGRPAYMMAPISLALSDIRGRRLFALGVSGSRRSSLLKDVPTIAEAGVAGFNFPIWYGLWAPVRTPTHIVDQLAKDIARVLATPALRDWLAAHGAERMNMTRTEFTLFVLDESEKARRIIKASTVTP